MDLGLIIGIAGILITILIYAIQTYSKRNNKKRNVSLILEEKECYSLLNADTKGLKIEIKHNNKVLDNPILLFKGTLTNNGIKDIDEKDIKKPLILKIDKQFSIIDSTLIEYPSDCKCTLNLLKKDEIEITWDLLKSDEKIEFQFILEVIEESESNALFKDYFYRSLMTECRITDLSNNKIKKSDINKKTRRAWFIVVLYSIIFIISIFILFDTYYFEKKFFSDYEPTYEIVNRKNNEIMQATLQIKTLSGETIIKNDKGREIIKTEDFNKKYSISKIAGKKQSKSSILFNTVYSVFVILLSIIIIPAYTYRIKRNWNKDK